MKVHVETPDSFRVMQHEGLTNDQIGELFPLYNPFTFNLRLNYHDKIFKWSKITFFENHFSLSHGTSMPQYTCA